VNRGPGPIASALIGRLASSLVSHCSKLRRRPARTGARSAFWIALAINGCNTPAAPSGITPAIEPNRPSLIAGPADVPELAPFIARELARSQTPLLVYVGAGWCEPCQRFHAALTAGQLDRELGGVRFLEFDYDKSSAALKRAGYVSKLIPLFAIPKPDGRASDRAMEGSIKGPTAVADNLLPRLHALLAGNLSAP
jgi:thiol-disulfide isomerase/thioredoxin